MKTIPTWQERAAPDFAYWGESSPSSYMQAEIDDLRAALAATAPESALADAPFAWATNDGRVATDKTKSSCMAKQSAVNFNIPLYTHPAPSQSAIETPFELPAHWRAKAKHIVEGRMTEDEQRRTAVMLLSVMLLSESSQSADQVRDALTDADIAGLYHASQGQTLREQDSKRVNAMARAVEYFIKASPAPAAQESAEASADSQRLDWLDQQGYAYGFEDMHEGNRWWIDGQFANLRLAIDAARFATSNAAKGAGDAEHS